jgi:cytochrome P450
MSMTVTTAMELPAGMTPADHADSLALEDIDVSYQKMFQDNVWQPYFARLRREDPVHYTRESPYGPYWSVTKFRDIIEVEKNFQVFRSGDEFGGISIFQLPEGKERGGFLHLDPPEHDRERAVVQPALGSANLANMENLIRERTRMVLDTLPRDEPFDWVDLVSKELTTMMLATLFDFEPFEERRKLAFWSDCMICDLNDPHSPVHTEDERYEQMLAFGDHMGKLWEERKRWDQPGFDLISILAHHPVTKDKSSRERLGNLVLLLIGGNDTTRNTMSGGMWLLSQNPQERQKLAADPSLLDSAVSEMIRCYTPVMHQRRTPIEDIELGGKTIRKGEKVVMWYVSGNQDEDEIDQPERFIVGRPRARHHISFGFGVHRCLGNRLAELQLRILWEEVFAREMQIEVLGPPSYTYSNYFRTVTSLPVQIAP